MAIFHAIAFAAFFLEYDYFVALYKRSQYFANYFGAFYSGRAYLYSTIGVSEEYTVKFYCVAFFGGIAEIVDIQILLRLCLELLSLNFYNCVHC